MGSILSVGFVAGELRKRAELSLRHILSQSIVDKLEILVIDLNPEKGRLPGTDHPRVRVLDRPQYRYYYEAQAELVLEAKAPLVAFLEDHTYAAPQWAEAVVKAFTNSKVAAVSYAFTSANGRGYLKRSILMAEYGHWMAPHPGGAIGIASSTNVAYRRELLLEQIREEQAVFQTEFLVQRAIQRNGGEIHVAPEALVAHESWSCVWDACVANGANKRMLSAHRAARNEWGLMTRGAWAGGMLLLPAVAVLRLGWVMRNRRPLWATYIKALPVIAAIYSYAAYQEALGYLFGAGRSREAFCNLELGVRRDG